VKYLEDFSEKYHRCHAEFAEFFFFSVGSPVKVGEESEKTAPHSPSGTSAYFAKPTGESLDWPI
jgi:hypothetical protein